MDIRGKIERKKDSVFPAKKTSTIESERERRGSETYFVKVDFFVGDVKVGEVEVWLVHLLHHIRQETL
jgi:hypothetical protein